MLCSFFVFKNPRHFKNTNKMAELKRTLPVGTWNNVYNKYKHPGTTDKEIKHKYGMSDSELDSLVFTNYHEYATIMEEHRKKKNTKKNNPHNIPFIETDLNRDIEAWTQ